ncbi:MAG: transcription elongation factor GreA [Phycisphaerales bacterium]|nr:transcription elongation factor GreA [Phycisphaerales bacterium]
MEIISKSEKETIEARLAALIQNRPVLATRIADARALGDLKENAEYHAARELQGLEEAEIRRLEERLARAQVVDAGAGKDAGVVFLGSTVKLRDESTGDEELYRLVGEASTMLIEEYIEVTVSSPMGEALMKARIGETVRVRAPRGVKAFVIIEIL